MNARILGARTHPRIKINNGAESDGFELFELRQQAPDPFIAMVIKPVDQISVRGGTSDSDPKKLCGWNSLTRQIRSGVFDLQGELAERIESLEPDRVKARLQIGEV